jgi:hypothetical protein
VCAALLVGGDGGGTGASTAGAGKGEGIAGVAQDAEVM